MEGVQGGKAPTLNGCSVASDQPVAYIHVDLT